LPSQPFILDANGLHRQARRRSVIQRQGDGFPLDRSRVFYLRYLRLTTVREADADHVQVKTEMLQMRLREKRRELMRRDTVNDLIDAMCGTVLTHLSGMATRCMSRQ
jgi:hypothetical protein